MASIDRSAGVVSYVVAAFGLLCSVALAKTPSSSIIPQPVEMKVREGVFRITSDTKVIAEGKAAAEATKLIDALAPAMGFRLRPGKAASRTGNAVALSISPSLHKKLGDEGYTLEVTADRIELRAAKPAGLFYGVQTLRQLLPAAAFRHAPAAKVEWSLPCLSITDYPRFAWRGLLIDPARHFIPKRDMMRFLDAMALHKFNRLQVHFTDGQGWRIESRKYPLLTQVGSRMHNSMGHKRDLARIYGGFYTQDDVRELVRYAAERHVTIVPEIEMPNHAGSAIVAYPRLGFDPERLAALPPQQRWARAGNLVVPRPQTVAFMKDVLDEVCELFPSLYIHIGGDEAQASRWAKLPEIREQMKRLKLADVHELHSWFIKQMDAHLTKRGRKLVGWDEILQGGLAEGATVMSWRGTSGGIAAARAGHDVVMAPTSHTYFDYRQAADKSAEPPALGNSVITLDRVYRFEPIPDALNAKQAGHILGGQAQLWGEFIPNERHREYMAYPRACALIEALWSPREHRDYARFTARLTHHLERLKAAGIHFRPLDPPAQAQPAPARTARDP
jgi:hexosaminidase